MNDLSNQKFGRWAVLGLDRSSLDSDHPRWFGVCECGTRRSVLAFTLKSGASQSCGCLSVEATKIRVRQHPSFGYNNINSRTHRIWAGMKQRCLNPNNVAFKLYGAKGITVCDRWLRFDLFLTDMGECPEGKEIDRINGTLGYCPENCRWATRQEQMSNTIRNHWIEHDGKRQTLSEWSREWSSKTGVSVNTLRSRICVLGYTPKRAVSQPILGS